MNLYERWMLVLAMLLVITLLDILTGYDLSFFVFYFLPVAAIAWWGQRAEVLLICVCCALFWYLSDVLSDREYSAPFYQYWNTGIRFASFLAIGFAINAMQRAQKEQRILAAELQKSLDIVQRLAETDALTALANQRIFYKNLDSEIARARRHEHPFTIAYIDLDNFKEVNDSFGHDVGDDLLRQVAECLRVHSRETDTVARLGGDEFGVILPETDKGEAAVALNKIRDAVIGEMKKKDWPVTCSIGVVTFTNPPGNGQDAIKQADDLMYSVKKSGKNNIAQAVWPET